MGHHLVRFYDSSKSWCVRFLIEYCLGSSVRLRQWVEHDQLLLLGENDGKSVSDDSVDEHQQPFCVELDQSLLTASKRQKFSSAKMRQGCRESYRYSAHLEPLHVCADV
jgi:hypothetical protein